MLHVVIAVNIILWYSEKKFIITFFLRGTHKSSSPVDDISVRIRPEAVTRRGEGGHDLTQGGVDDVLDRDHRHGDLRELGGRVQLVGVGGGGGALVARLVRVTSQGERLGPDLPANVDNDEDTEEGRDDGDGDTHNKAGHARVRVTLRDAFPGMIMDQEISSLTVGAGRGTVL